jgi:hypothetical protein
MKIPAIAIVLSLLLSPAALLAAPGDFVRTADYYLLSGSALNDTETIKTLSSFDLIVIPSEAQTYNQAFFPAIRALNPDIIILAYVPTVSWNNLYWTDPLHKKMKAGIQDSWWLRDNDGSKASIWPNTNALDLNSGWSDYLAAFVRTDIMSSGEWDGIFYDEVLDRDDWEDGYAHLFSITRQKLGPKAIIITNGSSKQALTASINGRMFETFPSTGDAVSSWNGSASDYLSLSGRLGYDPIIVVNVNTKNMGTKEDFQKMRFGLATSLLGNGYFSFDYGTEDHTQLWTYDEYDVALGEPKGDATAKDGIWEREYEQGKVLANPTDSPKIIELDGEFEKIHGTQDPVTNNGSIVSRVSLNAQDGLLLLRPLDQIYKATYLNGAFARIFSSNGTTKRNGFFAYSSQGRGGTRISVSDTDRDGKDETVVADNTYVTVYDDDGSMHARFAPYTDAFRLGINIAVKDLEGDGSVEIVTGTENGGGAQIRIFNTDGALINPGFFAYDPAFRGGVNVAVGDLDGNGTNEIVAGAGVGGGPHVRVFNKDGKLINPGFFAYDPAFRGGVNVAVGDVDADEIDEIVTGPGLGGGPHVRVFDRDGHLRSQFFAFGESGTDGVEVAASDVDADGRAEVIGLSSDVFTLSFE